jgi:hypothetical protein
VGIALKGGVVPSLDEAMVAVGVGGVGAGAGNTDMSIIGKGSTGLACKTLDFGNPTSMTACAM